MPGEIFVIPTPTPTPRAKRRTRTAWMKRSIRLLIASTCTALPGVNLLPAMSTSRFVDPLGDGDQGPHEDWEFDRMEEMDLAGLSHTSSHRFSGTSILCDIPQLLDDSLARLINAVAIRSFFPQSVSKQTEPSSSSTDAFQYYLNLPPGLEKANIEAEEVAE